MPIETNLNVAPYYDDFDPEKNFHRVLFRPGVALQAREVTQLQSILQDQIEKFGDNIYRIGSIINGCNITTDYNYRYVKILDTQVDGQPVVMSQYANTLLVQEGTGLTALVVNFATGFESLNPDLNTLYIKYINTGSGGQKVFSNSQVITVYGRARSVEDVTIISGGSGYSNSDTVTFTSAVGTGAVAEITTDASGTVTDVSVTSGGSGYTGIPTVTINTSTGIGASLTAINYIAQITVASSAFDSPVGTGTAVKCTEGVVYQKGHFIRVDEQEAILTKYNTEPDQIVVGISVSELIVNSSIDESLLDLSIGSPNYTAPGANRLKLSPALTVLTTTLAASNNEFMPLLEFETGKVIKDRTDTQFNSVNKELAKRTFDESGNYVVSQFTFNTKEIAANNTHFNLDISPGVAYVEGSRIQLLNSSKKVVRKGTDTSTTDSLSISTSYGNYLRVNNLVGAFDIKSGDTIILRDTAGTDVADNSGNTPSTPGVAIGTAKVKSLEYLSGVPGTPSCEYRLYVFDTQMNSGRSFEQTRSVSSNGIALADIVLVNARAVLNDVTQDVLLYTSGINAVKEFTSERFSFRTSTNATFTTSGSVTVSFSGGNTIPYGTGTLGDSDKETVIVIPAANVYSSTPKTGVVSANTGSALLVASASAFTTEFEVGDYISIGNTTVFSTPQRIVSISNNTSMQLSGNFSGLPGGTTNAVSNSIFVAYPANVPVDFTKNNKVMSVPSNTSITFDLGHGIRDEADFTFYHDLENLEPAVRTKTLNNPIYIKLSTDKIGANTNGPWCLGVPDVLSIEGVFVGSGNTYVESSNLAEEFELVSGQKDNYYGLSYLTLRAGSSLSLSSSNSLLVKVKAFTHGTGKYLSAESYPVDDVTSPLPADKIRTQSIPYFISPTTGEYYDLRDSVDFRPIVANTAALSTTIAGASVDPLSSETLTGGDKFFPSPSRPFRSSAEYYLNRIDRVVINSLGEVSVIEGIPSRNPVAPSAIRGTMDLALISPNAFPSLSAKEASDAKRPDLSSSIQLLQTKGYNMRDIGNLEKRIRTLEYYSLLNSLESNTINITIPSESNNQIERFKNGFIVDSFDNFNVANINDSEFRSIINNSKLQPLSNTVVVDVKYNSSNSSNIRKTGDIVTLDYTDKLFVSQSLANKERTLVQDYWNFAGDMLVVPPLDNFFDVSTSATSSVVVDIATPLLDLTNSINENFRAQGITSTLVANVNSNISSSTTSQWFNGFLFTNTTTGTTTTTTTTTTTGQTINVNADVVSDVVDINGLVNNVNVDRYVRENQIFIYANGLRPGAEHHVFFDSVNLTAGSRPALISQFTDVTRNAFTITGPEGTPLVANNTGELAVAIFIPGNTFITGEKSILLMDVDNLPSETSATSKAVGKYSSFSLTGTSTNITFATRNFDTTRNNIFTGGTFTDTSVSTVSRNWTQVSQWWWDPLVQTFTVQRQQGGDTVQVTKLDLFFKQKDPALGVAVEIRETLDDGTPSQLILPFSKVHLQSAQVNVSDDASVPTTFIFESPVTLRVDRDYAITMIPDQNSPEYRVWTAKTGLPDVANPNLISNASWGQGTMFYSTSGRSYTPVQDEDVKFNLYRADYSSLTGTLAVNNGDYEFLKVTDSTGAFKGGEDIAQLSNSYLNTILSTNTSSDTINTSTDLTSTLSVDDTILVMYANSAASVSGNVSTSGTTLSNGTSVTNSNFTANFSNGDFIRLANTVRQVVSVSNNTFITLDAALPSNVTDTLHYTIDPVYDVLKVRSATPSTIKVDKYPTLATNSTIVAGVQKVVSGVVGSSVLSTNTLIIANSTAASDSFKFRQANSTYLGYVIGDGSQAFAKVSSVENVNTSFFTTYFNSLITNGTGITLSATLTKASGTTDTDNYPLSSSNFIRFNEDAIVKSKSNEIAGSTINKSFKGLLTLNSLFTDASPVFDLTSSILFNNYVINNSSANENTRYGNAACRYVTKTLTLADGLDAEDIRVYLDAYKPSGTEIEVYAKIMDGNDSSTLDDKDWSKLEQISNLSVFSSSLNENEIREYEYTFKRSPLSSVLPGKGIAYSNSTVGGVSTTFQSSLVAGDIVKIVNTSSTTDYDIIPVTTVNSNTSLTLASNVSFTGTGLTIEKVINKKEAFKFNKNSNIVSYFDDSNSLHIGYKYLALKIVLRTDRNIAVPKVENLRAIACSV
jgi:hypothetical protein